MIQNKQTFFLGIFILLIWIFFGIPTSWKVTLTVLSSLYLIVMSVKITLPRRGASKRPRKKEKTTPVFSESAPSIPLPKSPDIEISHDTVNQSNQN